MNEEEHKLESWKKTIESREIPENDLDKAIQQGLMQAKQQKTVKARRKFIQPFMIGLTAAAVFLLFVTTIRISPAFADAVASFPGMKKIVALIEDDKGLKSAIRNEHFQKIGVSGETSGVQITLDGVIPGEQNLVLFYTISYKPNHRSDFLENVWIKGKDGEDLEVSSIGHHPAENYETANQSTNAISVNFNKPLSEHKAVLEFTFIGGNGEKENILLPFTFDIEDAPSYTYAVDQKIVIDDQSLTVQQVTVNPVITSVDIEFDPDNTKDIFAIEDLAIKGKWGRTWASIQNGVTASSTEEHPNRVTYFLQSSYFNTSKDLKLQIGKIMALDKDEAELIIDTEAENILKQPVDKRFSNLRLENGEILIDFKGEKDFYHYPVSINFEDANKEIRTFDYWSGSPNGEPETTLKMKLPDTEIQNPIKLEINGYPAYLKQEKPETITIQ